MLLSLANELKVLPTDLNRLLIIVVVLSMALTPFLAEAGKRFAESTVEDDSDGAHSNPFMSTPMAADRAAQPISSWYACKICIASQGGLLREASSLATVLKPSTS